MGLLINIFYFTICVCVLLYPYVYIMWPVCFSYR